jgi:hypothetical protein
MSDAIYRRSADVYHPNEWAGGPWSKLHQHGGAVAALLARGAATAASETGLRVARLTLDLFRPVPVRPLRMERRFPRAGHRIAVAELSLFDGDVEVTRASALLLRERDDLDSSFAALAPADPAPPAPAHCEEHVFIPPAARDLVPPGFHWTLELRTSKASEAPVVWLRSPLDVVEGEATRPIERAAAVSDLCFAMASRALLRRSWGPADAKAVRFINVDTTLYFEREPEGEWFAMRPSLVSDRAGVGVAEVVVYDARGRYGRVLQALLANTPAR